MINEKDLDVVETNEIEKVTEVVKPSDEAVTQPLSPRQEMEQELQSYRQQFAQAKLNHQEYVEAAATQKIIMTEAGVLIRYVESKLERLPKE